ncbi:AER373Cp [Eremothecium gossypii ATCC 10895]|uniref:AER373Cp n=1 Tax=Eremothecium gossypii (strain ATCC 10895 / CBS 109.51 / FGSC 9923 / NRRL Y-1056) TaxID=284811 RepID=Q755Z4_EREGS|nr:AER373Cp [Eremothecium gossypii ATCC 10895]AAS53053.1 AER373Cp [Eremothecium gossypii ATCC 10895]AEY97361.1 FAER373Cp [Eremothecium gossypii FDAG1]
MQSSNKESLLPAEAKVVLVTGASSGIGYELTKELANRGYVVYAAARSIEPIEALRDKCGPEKVIPVQLDVTDEEQVTKLRRRMSKEIPGGKLHALFNNAGQSCTMPAVDVTPEMIEKCFRVNVFAPMNITREFAPLLIRAHGTIVFTGSLAGIIPFPFGSVYSATKAAVHQYARVLHLELKPFGVRVINAVTGGVATNIADTRPLPKSSVYNFAEGKAAFAERQRMASRSSPMPAPVYARKLVSDLESSDDPLNVYRGHLATVLSWLELLLPHKVLEWGLNKAFGLFPVYDALEARKRKD